MLILSVTTNAMTLKFCDLVFTYLLATFWENFMSRDAVNSKKNAVIPRKNKKYSLIVKLLTSEKIARAI